MESRSCNVKPCRGGLHFQRGSASLDVPLLERGGQWSCWGEWTACSVSCGFGMRSRARECLGPGQCEGMSQAIESCEMPSCEWYRGWDQWTGWSRCDDMGAQHRRRKCLYEPGDEDCLGPSTQTRPCLNEILDNGRFRVLLG